MTGTKFESELCELFKAIGYWALNIPRNQSGAQPFDVLAISEATIFAIDCKVCSTCYFSLDRVEDNQWLAFEMMRKKTKARVGVMALYDGDIYFLPYELLKAHHEDDIRSIKLGTSYMRKWWTKDQVKKILGRYME